MSVAKITTVEAAARWIQDYLRDGPRPVPFRKEGHISQQPLEGQAVRNVKTKAFREALKQLGVTTLKSGPKGGACWHMPVANTPVTISNEALEEQTAGLVHYSAMCWEIEHCARVDEVKNIRDKAMALAVYARQAQNYEAEKLAAEVRLRAEIRAGELLKTTERAKPGQAGGGTDGKGVRPSVAPKLSDFGVSKAQSSQWQLVASIPEKEREAYIAAPGQIPSASGLLNHAVKTIEAQQPAAATVPEPAASASARKKVLLNVNNLRLADLCQKEQSRYTLDAIQVTREETVVTNGFYLVRVTLPRVDGTYPDVEGWPTDSGEWTEALIPRATAIEALKNIPRKQKIPILNNAVVFKDDDGRVRIGTKGLAARNDRSGDLHKMVDGKQAGRFPDWKAVMPKGTPQFTITLDADLVARLAKNAAEFMADGRPKPLRLRFTTADGAVRMDCTPNHEGQQWTAILMPMRDDAYRNDYETDQ